MERFQPRQTPQGQSDPPVLMFRDTPAMQQPPASDGDEIDVRGQLIKIWQGKWIILVTVLFAGIMGSLFNTQQPAMYTAVATVMFDASRANIDAGEAVVSDSLDQGSLQNQIEVLRSTSLLQRVVDELGLVNNPEFNPRLVPREPTWRDRISIPPEINDLLIAVGVRDAPGPPAPPPDPEVVAEFVNRLVVENVRRSLRVFPVDRSEVIQIVFTSGSPRLSADVVNAVADQYIVDQLEGKLQTFRAATSWLTERVGDLQARVEEAESAVIAAQAEIAAEVGANLDSVEQQLVALTAAQATARAEAADLQARFARLSRALDSSAEIDAMPEFRDVPAIAALLAREDELLATDEELSNTLLPSHPSRERIADSLEDVRVDLREAAGQELDSLRLSLELAQDREAQMATEIAELEQQQLRLSEEAVEIRNLEREAQANRILYENLLSRLQETNAQEDLQTADARILSPAEPPLSPVRTAENRTMLMALGAGLIAGLGLVFLMDRLNNTFRAPAQIEQMLGAPVLATVPRAGSQMKRGDVLKLLRFKPNASLSEAIRNMRTSILFSNVDVPPRVVMFSSSVPREGKSTTSMMMAMTSQQMGKSAIIVDCDLRMPALAKVLQIKDETPGLLGVLNDTASIEEAVYVEPDTGLHVLMTRPSERVAKINAADVLASQKFRHLIEDLSLQYDLVVLDTPPTLVVADARIVSGLADAVVFCVRWDHTPRAAVQEGLRELQSVNAKLSGVVMTLINEKRASKYVYEGYSYYRGRYRDYYEA